MSDQLDQSEVDGDLLYEPVPPTILADGDLMIFDYVQLVEATKAYAARYNAGKLEVLNEKFKWIDVTTLGKTGSVTPIRNKSST